MSDMLILLAPLIVLVIVVLFGFVGCGGEPFTSRDTPPEQPPETPPTEPSEPYAKNIEATTGFLALWQLNETSGIVAVATSPILNIDGEYKPGATPGSEGAFFHKEPNVNFAPELNGTTGYIEVPFHEQLNPSTDPVRFSVELWVKPAGGIPDGEERIVISSHHTSDTGNHRGYEIALVGTGAGDATVRGRVFHINDGAAEIDVTLTSGDPSEWRHIVVTYDGPAETLTVYATVVGTIFDKAAAKQTAAKYSPVQAGGGQRPLRFGAGHLQAGQAEKFFAGRIDEVAFYQAVLPDVTAEAHFNLF
jgi:hypothetical protein